ncbi:MAG: hypothetical protein HOL22_00975 [Euryarchaeota archaeon]|nr:hypothetical protein [Euryarchaeota archaeon]MBT6641005.1 hypothetical protein [Euryarchaeota archaeon]MBT7263107.1 hypothetical protein [Euryarchaeota archaeon]MBT7637487.1 hypothetical protein [Euryarchaeota archaeon]
MLSTHSVHIAFQPEAKVSALALSMDGAIAVWAEGDGNLFIAQDSQGMLTSSSSWKAPALIRKAILRGNQIFVLDDELGLTCLDLEGNVLWQIEIGAGGFALQSLPSQLAVLDGLGRLHLVGYDGKTVQLDEEYNDILRCISVGEYLVLAHENGLVQALQNGKTVWSRPIRGDMGESITCLGFDSSQNLVIGREGYALVAGDEEVLEIEIWDVKQQVLVRREDLKSRLLQAIPSEKGLLCGFDNGDVSEYLSKQSTYTFEPLLSCGYPVQNLIFRNGCIAAASWFYIFGKDSDGREWKIEHQGMPHYLEASRDGSVCLFAGEDQNDWTEIEPIGIFSFNEELVEIDASELTLWFEKTEEIVELSAEELYRVDDEMNSFFSQEELDSMQNSQPADVAIDALHSALEGELGESQQATEDGTLDIDTDELLAQLDDAITNMALLPSEDLIEELNTQVGEIIVPRAISGDDQNLKADADGSAIVTLDGSNSFDPQGRIQTWSWIESSGKEIASSAKVRVKVPRGSHSFELRICDRDGQWSSDSLHILVE